MFLAWEQEQSFLMFGGFQAGDRQFLQGFDGLRVGGIFQDFFTFLAKLGNFVRRVFNSLVGIADAPDERVIRHNFLHRFVVKRDLLINRVRLNGFPTRNADASSSSADAPVRFNDKEP